MQYTKHYKLNLPEGADVVNPLTSDNPNYTKIDSEMYANKADTVQTARVSLQENTIAITRDESKPSTFKFVATMNYSPSMNFTVDGTVVTATLPDGSALAANAFRIGSIVLCAINGTVLNIYTVNSIDISSLVTTVREACYPVGSIYCNATDNRSPTTILGFGSWKQIQGSFLFGSDITHQAGSTGGASAITLQTQNIPSMSGVLNKGFPVDWGKNGMDVYIQTTDGRAVVPSASPIGDPLGSNQMGAYQAGASVSIGGSSNPVSIMPPYLSVYMWRRIS